MNFLQVKEQILAGLFDGPLVKGVDKRPKTSDTSKTKSQARRVPEDSSAQAASVATDHPPKACVAERRSSDMSRATKRAVAMTTNDTNTTTPATPNQVALPTRKDRGRPSKLKDKVTEIVALYNTGVSAKNIAEQYSVSVSCVLNTLRTSGVAIRAKGRSKKNPA